MKKKLLILIFMIMCCPTLVFADDTLSVTLEKCIDGDTATFKDSSGTTYKTRFLAIDTPETVHPTKKEQPFGKEASTYTCDSLTNAKEIILESDPNSDKEDKYGRYLAWVFVDGKLLQDELVSRGLAKVDYLYGDYKYTVKIQSTQEVAKTKKLGIWSLTDNTETTTTKDTKSNSKTSTSSKSKDSKNFIDKLIDDLLGKVIDYINSLLDNIATFIESMI